MLSTIIGTLVLIVAIAYLAFAFVCGYTAMLDGEKED